MYRSGKVMLRVGDPYPNPNPNPNPNPYPNPNPNQKSAAAWRLSCDVSLASGGEAAVEHVSLGGVH